MKKELTNRFKLKSNIRKGDMVIVISGKHKPTKNAKGEKEYKPRKVRKIFLSEGTALVEGVNVVKRHTKPSAKHPNGGIIEKEMPIYLSKLALIDPKSGKPTRVRRQIIDGKKIRIATKSGEAIL